MRLVDASPVKVFHFTGYGYGLDDIRRRRVKIATFDGLNDPFELFSMDLSNKTLRQRFGFLAATLNLSRGMICFSRRWDNPVQWSHYAESHRGFCLEFDVPESMLLSVSYKRKRLVAEAENVLKSGLLDQEFIEKLLATKYSHWRYEQESRLFVTLPEPEPETGLYFEPFSNHLKLTGIIVGALSPVCRAEVQEALGDLVTSVRCFKARLAFRSFRVVRQRKASLW